MVSAVAAHRVPGVTDGPRQSMTHSGKPVALADGTRFSGVHEKIFKKILDKEEQVMYNALTDRQTDRQTDRPGCASICG